jgi:hypothetical protein
MKKPLLLFFIILSNISFCQKVFTFDNNLTGIISTNTSTTTGLNYVGNNSFDINKISIDLGTTYITKFNKNLIENEFVQRSNIGYEKEKWDLFTTHQYNYSLLRKITSDNWLGIGGGVKKKYNWGKISISYAILYQSSNYFINDSEYLWRHSLRGRVKVEKKNWSLSSEYFIQPNVQDFKDCIIYGSSKLSLFTNKSVNFVIQDVINWRNTSDVKLIHNLTIGIGWKFSKKLEN